MKGHNNIVERKIWRCNQWWNEKCRARVYTINDRITPMNKFHTHSHVINRKPRVSKKSLKRDEFNEVLVKIETHHEFKN